MVDILFDIESGVTDLEIVLDGENGEAGEDGSSDWQAGSLVGGDQRFGSVSNNKGKMSKCLCW